jgi:alpha-D-ribose 1-methylphosphonate 5-triphosphate synthase subunit PhnH
MTQTAFAESSLASQSAFRAVMDVLARPGEIRKIEGLAAPARLLPAAAALIVMLADYETPVWLDPALQKSSAVGEWIRFQTGAPVTTDPSKAAFALIGDSRNMPDFTGFSLGSEDYPDRSTTVIAQIDSFAGTAMMIRGPGIDGTRSFAASPLPDDFVSRLGANRELFPRGVDLILTTGDSVAALPRSVRITQGQR